MSFFMVSSRRRPPGRLSVRVQGREPEPRIYLASQRPAGANPSRPPDRACRDSVVPVRPRGRLLDLHQELDVALRLLQALEQQLEGLLAVETGEHAAELPDDGQFLLAHQQLLATGAGLDGVDRGVETLVGEVAPQADLHVAGAL